mgnify:CR=1 FL=1
MTAVTCHPPSRTTVPNRPTLTITRGILSVIRAIPDFLYALIFGLEDTMEALPPGVLKILSASGVLIYAGVGLETIILGGNYLDYNFLAHEPTHGQHLGIFLVELGVGTTVFSTMLLLYYAFAGREPGQ